MSPRTRTGLRAVARRTGSAVLRASARSAEAAARRRAIALCSPHDVDEVAWHLNGAGHLGTVDR